jgi:hypothetical protein
VLARLHGGHDAIDGRLRWLQGWVRRRITEREVDESLVCLVEYLSLHPRYKTWSRAHLRLQVDFDERVQDCAPNVEVGGRPRVIRAGGSHDADALVKGLEHWMTMLLVVDQTLVGLVAKYRRKVDCGT